MKKIFLFLTAAALLAVACNKSETVVRELNPDEIGIRAFTGNITKGAELSGVILPNTYGIYAGATEKNAGGLIDNASFLGGIEKLFATSGVDPSGAEPDARLWRASPNPIYWPIGGVKLDFLAYAIKQASHVSELPGPGKWMASWDNATTDVATELAFKAVDTYANQEDVLYAVANGQSSAANGGTGRSVKLSFEHAQALLIFNVKANMANQLSIQEISFVTPERVDALRLDQSSAAADAAHAAWVIATNAYEAYQQYLTDKGIWEGEQGTAYAAIDANDQDYPTADEKTAAKAAWDLAHPAPDVVPVAENPGPEPTPATPLADLTEDDVMLKTIGTFTVNNQRNILAADWTFGEHPTSPDNYKMPAFGDNEVAVRSAANSASGSGCINYGATIVNTEDYTQLGETLLIPQQDKVNFTIKYKFGNQIMYYTFNDARGVWEKGKKYIYNLDLNLNEIVITEEVADYVSVVTPATL